MNEKPKLNAREQQAHDALGRFFDNMRSPAPWPDFAGNPIHHGDRLRHPEGTTFVAVHLDGFEDPANAWRAVYDNLEPNLGGVSRLAIQIGEKGQAVVVSTSRPAAAAPARKKCTCTYATAANTPAVRSGHEMGGYVKAEDPQCPIHGKATAQGAEPVPRLEIMGLADYASGSKSPEVVRWSRATLAWLAASPQPSVAQPHSWKEEQARFFGVAVGEVPDSPQQPTGTEKK